MPLFRTQPSGSLSDSIARAMVGPGITAAEDAAITSRAASTARSMALVEKARLEAQALRDAEAFRADPANATRYATHAAGLDERTGARLMQELRGAMEAPGPGDVEDLAGTGIDSTDVPVRAAGVDQQARRVYQNAIASTIANRLATGKTNAEQLAHATDRGVRTNVLADAMRAAANGDVAGVNMNAAGILGQKELTPFKAEGNTGVVLNEWTGAQDETSKLADLVRKLTGAKTAQAGAAAGLSSARAERVRSGATTPTVAVVKRGPDGKDMVDANGKPVVELIRRDQAVGRTPAPREFRPGVEGTSRAADVYRKNRAAAKKEYDALPLKDRKAKDFEKYFEEWAAKVPGAQDNAYLNQAHAAIAAGASPAAVRARYKKLTGQDLPAATVEADDGEEE